MDQIDQILYIGAGYVGSLSAIVMGCQNPEKKIAVYDINKELIHRWNHDENLPIFEPNLKENFEKATNVEFVSDNFNQRFK
jgi:UDP-glucose 6-dehydrogenase